MAKTVSPEFHDGKACAALAYLFPIGLVWYFADSAMRKNRFAKFHVHQSLAAALVVLGGWIVGMLLSVIFIGFALLAATGIAGLIWFVQGIYFSLKGREEPLFLIGAFGKRFDF